MLAHEVIIVGVRSLPLFRRRCQNFPPHTSSSDDLSTYANVCLMLYMHLVHDDNRLPHALHMFRFMISFASCFMMGKASNPHPMWGPFPICGVRLGYHLVLEAPYFGEYPPPTLDTSFLHKVQAKVLYKVYLHNQWNYKLVYIVVHFHHL